MNTRFCCGPLAEIRKDEAEDGLFSEVRKRAFEEREFIGIGLLRFPRSTVLDWVSGGLEAGKGGT